MNIFLLAIFSSVLVSLISLIGVFLISIKDIILQKIIIYLVAFSAGSLLGGAFIHLIPESIEEGINNIGPLILIGLLSFFLIEKFLNWHHCHQTGEHHHIKTLSYMNLVGDAIHNFIDGLIISASYLVSIELGVITSFNIALHEIPQEIGDFGVLIHGGISKTKALLYNLLSASSALLGTIIGLTLLNSNKITNYLIPFAAGGFIYIATSDLIPELKECKKPTPIILTLLLGISLMFLLKD